MNNQPVYLSVRQAATLLVVSPRTIHRYIKQQLLPAYCIAGQPTIRIKREDVEALLEPVTAAARPSRRLRPDYAAGDAK